MGIVELDGGLGGEVLPLVLDSPDLAGVLVSSDDVLERG